VLDTLAERVEIKPGLFNFVLELFHFHLSRFYQGMMAVIEVPFSGDNLASAK
jgi:hypothetical protein